MNTRLQVEHPITEQVTGVDLVRTQIEIAAGLPLPWSQDSLSQRGHAIEMRVYAEDPARQDLPQAGPLLLYREPVMPGIRVDSGYAEGGEVTVHYDPLLAKVIASSDSRESARRRAIAALRSFPILGIRTNIPLLLDILDHPRFISGDVDTGFLDAEAARLPSRSAVEVPPDVAAVAAAASRVRADGPAAAGAGGEAAGNDGSDPWVALRGVRV
jgi:acetyl/propionyl-CoA carboxylase alpha subunit